MIQLPFASCHCATCRYWSGPRKAVSANYIAVDSAVSGKCTKSGNANCGKDKNAMTDCSAWTKL